MSEIIRFSAQQAKDNKKMFIKSKIKDHLPILADIYKDIEQASKEGKDSLTVELNSGWWFRSESRYNIDRAFLNRIMWDLDDQGYTTLKLMGTFGDSLYIHWS